MLLKPLNFIFSTFLVFVLGINSILAQKFEKLAMTPPMGWNSWNTFELNVNEQLVKDVADAFITLGLKDAGYQYIVIDDGWMAMKRDSMENIVADPKKFPSGIKALADYVHSKGLKFGIYSCAGNLTCGGFPGGRGHEYQDAVTYASWGVDYLKYDWCHTEKMKAEPAYITMRDALYAAKRPVVFSICEWGDNQPWTWAKEVGHLWRLTGDVTNCWDCEEDHGTWSSWGVMRILHMRRGVRQVAGPGHWNDLDMLEVGNGMTASEDRSHFATWAISASPLIMGNDLRKTSKETLATLTSKEVIAVNQDPLGVQGFKHSDKNGLEVWAKPLQNNAWSLCFLNRNDKPMNLNFDWKTNTIKDTLSKTEFNPVSSTYKIRDLYQKQDKGNTKTPLQATIAPHDVLMVRLTKD